MQKLYKVILYAIFMPDYIKEPWPSTYRIIGDVEPKKLVSNFKRREVGAFRTLIPPKTIEPPQIHLLAERDQNPFEEFLTDFDKDFLIVFYDFRTKTKIPKIYSQGQDIIIPSYQIHWLVNKHNIDFDFTCEYAPYPWNENDEPEFENLEKLLHFIEKENLTQKVIEASQNFL